MPSPLQPADEADLIAAIRTIVAPEPAPAAARRGELVVMMLIALGVLAVVIGLLPAWVSSDRPIRREARRTPAVASGPAIAPKAMGAIVPPCTMTEPAAVPLKVPPIRVESGAIVPVTSPSTANAMDASSAPATGDLRTLSGNGQLAVRLTGERLRQAIEADARLTRELNQAALNSVAQPGS